MNIPDITSFFTFFQENGILFIFKVLFLILLSVFIIYCFIVVTRVKTLNRTLYMHAAHASAFIQVAATVILLAAISLFIITLVIV
jgi:hypothetical protein